MDNLSDLKDAIGHLERQYRQLREHLKTESTASLDFIESRIRRQDELIQSIQDAEGLREQYRQKNEPEFEERLQTLRELRGRCETLLDDEYDQLQDEVDSTQQSISLMSEYKQRDEESYYMDDTY